MGLRPIHEALLACPILITFEDGSSGSGFLLGINDVQFLITARHVLYDDSYKLRNDRCRLICQTRVEANKDTKIFATEFNDLNVFHSTHDDIAIIDIGRKNSDELHLTKGTRVEQENELNTTGLYKSNTLTIEEAYEGNDVYVFGYPTSIGLKRLPQYDFSKPLIRKGIISGINKENETIIIDCPVYHGNSGGPVLIAEMIAGGNIEYKVIGIVSQLIPYEEKWYNKQSKLVNTYHYNSGYSVVISMNRIFKLLIEKGYSV